jgi:hypothetical protein
MQPKKTKPTTEEYDPHEAMRVQLSRLFGSSSQLATSQRRTPAQWKKVLKAVLREVRQYVSANVDTDELHRFMLFTSIYAAEEALKQDDFWPGYVEGVTRLTLLLLGDYPDHRKRKKGRKEDDHYKLNLLRSAQWAQTPDQRFRTFFGVGNVGFPELSARPLDVLHEFRDRYGYRPSQADFMEWYRQNYPGDYAKIFR